MEVDCPELCPTVLFVVVLPDLAASTATVTDWWAPESRCHLAKAFKICSRRRNILQNGNTNCRLTKLQVSVCSLYSAAVWYNKSLQVSRTSWQLKHGWWAQLFLDKDTGIVVNSHYHRLLAGLHGKSLGSSWKKSGWNYKLQWTSILPLFQLTSSTMGIPYEIILSPSFF